MSLEETKRLEDAWTRFLAGDAVSTLERAALAAAAERDELFRRRLLQDVQVDGALRAMGQLEREQETFVGEMRELLTAANRTDEVVAAVRKRIESRHAEERATAVRQTGARGRWFALGFVASAAIAVLVLWPRARTTSPGGDAVTTATNDRSAPATGGTRGRGARAVPAFESAPAERARETIARVETLEGRAYVHGGDGSVRSAAELTARPGDWVSTVGSTSRASLVHVGGDRLELQGDVSAGLGTTAQGSRIFLAHGRAVATLAEAPDRDGLSVASPHAIVTGAGTIRLSVTAVSTRIDVTKGRAHVAALGVQRGTEVEAGQFALVRADGLQPPQARAAVREALLLVGPDDTKEERPAPPALRASEEQLKARLERLGFAVRAIEATTLSPEEASAASVLVLSSSVSVSLLPRSFAEMAVPMVLLESTAFSAFGLTGERWKRDIGPSPSSAEVVITKPEHPLAGGLSGTVRVLATPRGMRWAAPPPGADTVAGPTTGAEHLGLVFGYERGAAMEVGTAPARRVALFLGNGVVIRQLTEQGWQLFDAAVSWCAGRR